MARPISNTMMSMDKSLLLAAALFALSASCAVQAQRGPDLARVEALVIQGTNELRQEEHLPQVERNARLQDAVREFAAFMARTGRFDHQADGRNPSARARAHRYELCLIAENISYLSSSADFETTDLAKRLFEGWKNSPGHRKNMLQRDATDTAVAVARSTGGGAPRYYAVQMFGRPVSERVEFSVRNASDALARYRLAGREYEVYPGEVRTHAECGPQALAFDLPGDGGNRGSELNTRGGDTFVVRGSRGHLSIKRE